MVSDNSSDPDFLKFKNRFLHLVEKDINCDCEFVVGFEETYEVKGHKLLFSAASEVFHAMFYGELKEESPVRIVDFEPEAFQGMREFIYTGEVNFTSTIQALSIYIAAQKYIIPALSKKCINFIREKQLQSSEVIEFYEICKRSNILEFEDLYNKGIQQNTEKVVESEDYLSAGPEVIEFILKSPSLNLNSEIDVFHHFERWVLAAAERKGIEVGEIMVGSIGNLKKYIRFLSISPDDFVSKVAGSSLLTPEEKVAVACNLKNPDPKSMPESLSQEWQPREFIPSSLQAQDPDDYRHKHAFAIPIDDPNSSHGEYSLNCKSTHVICINCTISWEKVVSEYICFEVFLGNIPYLDLITVDFKLEVIAGKICHPLSENSIHQIPKGKNAGELKIFIARIPKSELRKGCFLINKTCATVTILCSFSIIGERDDVEYRLY